MCLRHTSLPPARAAACRGGRSRSRNDPPSGDLLGDWAAKARCVGEGACRRMRRRGRAGGCRGGKSQAVATRIPPHLLPAFLTSSSAFFPIQSSPLPSSAFSPIQDAPPCLSPLLLLHLFTTRCLPPSSPSCLQHSEPLPPLAQSPLFHLVALPPSLFVCRPHWWREELQECGTSP